MKNISNISEMDYTEYIAYLKAEKVQFMEQQFTDLEIHFTTYTLVSSIDSELDPIAFDNDGGMQLDFKEENSLS